MAGGTDRIAMGLISDGTNYTVLIQGLEDHFEIWTLKAIHVKGITVFRWILRFQAYLPFSSKRFWLMKWRNKTNQDSQPSCHGMMVWLNTQI